jgi:anti-sigma factor RsiW
MTDTENHAAEHQRCQRALPWYVNGTLPSDQAAQLERHLERCPRCAADLRAERAVQDQLRAGDAVMMAPQSGWQRMAERLNAADEALARGAHDTANVATPWRWATAVQAVAIIGLLVVLGRGMIRDNDNAAQLARLQPSYQTLTAAPSDATRSAVRVVFRQDATVADINALLRGAAVQVVAGPTEAGVYTLGTADDGDATAATGLAARLRDDARVIFAEPTQVESPNR